MATARTEMGRAPTKEQQNELKAKTSLKKQRQPNYTKPTKEGVLKVARKIKRVWARKIRHRGNI